MEGAIPQGRKKPASNAFDTDNPMADHATTVSDARKEGGFFI